MRAPKTIQKPVGAAPGGVTASFEATIGAALRLPDPFKRHGEQRDHPGAPVFGVAGLASGQRADPGEAAAQPTQSNRAGEQPNLSARGWFELALTSIAMGEDEAGVRALREATTRKPDFAAAWKKLGDRLKLEGDTDGAEAAYASFRNHVANDVEPARVFKAAPSGKLEAVERQLGKKVLEVPPKEAGGFLRKRLRSAPTDVAAMRILAEIGARSGHFQAAELLLERAIDLAPGYINARRDYAAVLLPQGKNVQALSHIEWLLAQEPRNVFYRTLLARCLGSIGEYDRSLATFEGIKGEVAKQPKLLLNYAHVLKYTGRRADSVQAYRNCLKLAPAMGEAWWSLANMKNELFSAADTDAMRGHLARPGLSSEDRYHLHYALGRALEQSGDYAGSFENYSKGAALRRANIDYSADDWSSQMDRAKAVFNEGFFADRKGWGCADPAPIFILGMPRAGSTLIEQILASHNAVEGTQELPEIANIARDLRAGRDNYVERTASLDAATVAQLGQRYIDRTRIYRKSGKPFFIDKMPPNWAYTGLIRLILPNAKIIDARRQPLASCFSAFKQLFGGGADYSYDFNDLGRFYNDYLGLMAHFDRIQPGIVYRVLYETLVADTEAETRKLLDYCKLDFEPACLRFWESKRAVATPSSEQVRQPIFRDGLDQWRNYEPWLGPLKAVLDSAAQPQPSAAGLEVPHDSGSFHRE